MLMMLLAVLRVGSNDDHDAGWLAGLMGDAHDAGWFPGSFGQICSQ